MKKKLMSFLLVFAMVMGIFWVPVMSAEPVTWNPNVVPGSVSNGNLTVTNAGLTGAVATQGKDSGKWYWEIKLVDGATVQIGAHDARVQIAQGLNTPNYSNVYDPDWGRIYNYPPTGGAQTFVNAEVSSPGDVIGVALDIESKAINYYKNGKFIGTSPNLIQIDKGPLYPTIRFRGAITVTANFGATPFAYPIPSGYLPYDNSSSVLTPTPIPMPTQGVTWNPDIVPGSVSNGNLTVTDAGLTGAVATQGKDSGKWYWEIKLVGGNSVQIGAHVYTNPASNNYNNVYDPNWGQIYYYPPSGGAQTFVSTEKSSPGDVIGVALDIDSRAINYYKNGKFIGTSLNLAQTNKGPLYPSIRFRGATTVTANFGATPFAYPIPSGYLPYNNGSSVLTPTPMPTQGVTWNPDIVPGSVSNGNLTVTNAGYPGAVATQGKDSGKWYWEIKLADGNVVQIGAFVYTNPASDNYNNVYDPNWGQIYYYPPSGGAQTFVSAEVSSPGDVIGVALDIDSRAINYYKNGKFIGTSLNLAQTNKGPLYPSIRFRGATTVTANFGATPFAYPVPSGYLPYDNSSSAPTPTPIPTPAPTDPSENSDLKAPQKLCVEQTDTEYLLSWGVVKNASKYEVSINGNIVTTTDTTIKVNDIGSRKENTVLVRAVNETKTSPWSMKLTISLDEEIITPPTSGPSQPINEKDPDINIFSSNYRESEHASDVWYNSPDGDASKALDGDFSTRWATSDNNYDPAVLTLNLKDVMVFNEIFISEISVRTAQYTLEYLSPDTNEWVKFHTGTGIGDSLTVDGFGDVITKSIRATFNRRLDEPGGVSIIEFQARYK